MTDDSATALQMVFYVFSMLMVLMENVGSIAVIIKMTKRRIFGDTEWRVKTILIVYALGGLALLAFIIATELVTFNTDDALSVFFGVMCAWTSVHW